MENLVFSISSLFSLSPEFTAASANSFELSVFFSALGAFILGKFTGNMGGLTLPLNFSALFIGTTIANYLLNGLNLNIDREIQQPMFVSMVGMIVASIVMIWWLQSDRARG